MTKSVLTLSFLLAMTACQGSAAPSPDDQAIVERVAAAHPDVVRLSVHTIPPGGSAMCAVASTAADKLGKPSDPEDLRAIASGETLLLEESGAVDYTVPVRQMDGKFTATVGVTLKSGGDATALMAKAKAIAAEVAGMMK